ncbi:MAG: amidase [SAR324 cluster bacterium]|nr:amidase [SAR324 cluster bacterium]
MADTPLHYQTIGELGRSIRAGKLSPVELTEHLLARSEHLDSKLNAYRFMARQRALAEARAAETALGAGQDLGPLHGIPFAVKDLYDVKNMPTTAGTHLLESHQAAEDCTAVHRLARAGMILTGKTNTVQFAYGGVGINHDHGTPHNPWHETPHAPGGSSSGSGVAVASGQVPIALGSDTGGSVRIPAALCGTTGLKTTVGRISRAGVYPLSWSLDSVGPLTRSVEDAALVYQAMQGPDLKDSSTVGVPGHDVLQGLKDGVRGLRLAFAETVFWEEVHPEVAAAVRESAKVFEEQGAQVGSVEFPEAEEARQLNSGGLIIAAEAYTCNRKWVDEHFDELDPIVAHRIVKGRDIPAHEYLSIIRAWEGLRAKADFALRDVDALLVPSTAIPALPVAEVDADKDIYSQRNLQYLRNTYIGNVLGLCGLSVPCGFTSKGLPIGLMIYCRGFQEETVLRIGYAFQQGSDWHSRRPQLGWAGEGD